MVVVISEAVAEAMAAVVADEEEVDMMVAVAAEEEVVDTMAAAEVEEASVAVTVVAFVAAEVALKVLGSLGEYSSCHSPIVTI